MFIHNVPGLPPAELSELKAVSEAIIAEYKAVFPESFAGMSAFCLGTGYHVTTCIGNKSTYLHNILMNDQLHHVFSITKGAKGIDVTLSTGGSIAVLPERSYYAMGHVRIPFRKKSGAADKVIALMAKHFGAMKSAVIENAPRIYRPEALTEIINNLK
jgi:hypothetical protein